MKRIVIAILAAMLVAGAQTKDEAERLLKAARNVELVDGNLNAAIKQYDAIIAKYKKTDRAVTATALVRKAECLQKQGDAEARKIYEQVVKDYADQKDAVALATARLSGAQAGQPPTRLVWAGPKSDNGDSVSPDGRYLSYTDWETGNLAVHDFVTGADRLLTAAGSMKRGEEAFADGSAISRDGKQIAYAWWDDKPGRYQLRVANLNGDPNPRRLFESAGMQLSGWSPDGKWIAVSLIEKRDEGRSFLDQTRQIGLIDVQDGSLRVLKSGPGSAFVYGFSPDGKYILYTHRTPDSVNRAYILSLDAKSDVPLVSGPSPVQSPVWTSDGSRIVFGSVRNSVSTGLWFVRVANGKPQGEPQQLRGDFGSAHPIGFARDGSLFYLTSSWQSDIYVAGLDPATGKLTSEAKRVNERAIGNSWGRIAWLPDGKSLSFWNRRNERDALVVHTLATGEERELWEHEIGGNPGYAGWFPDGRSLMSWQVNGQSRVFRRVDVRTGETQATWTIPALPTGAAGGGFSPDLMTWYFQKRDDAVPCEGAKCTFVMLARDLETGRDREIFRTDAASLNNPSISPDGRDLAFIALSRDGRSLMVAPTAGGAPRELYRGTDALGATAWTQDGGHVLALYTESAREAVWSFPTKGGPPEKSQLHAQISGGGPAVSPDGTQVAFVGGNNTSGIWVMTGLFQDAKPAVAR